MLTVTGSGQGPTAAGDHLHFVYRTLPAGGNFRLTARLASFTGGANSQAGLIVRGGLDNPGSCATIIYRPGAGAGKTPNFFQAFARDTEPGAHYLTRGAGCNFAMGAPCYLQLVRWGNNFAVSVSNDGVMWAPVHDSSGGPFEVQGPFNVGLFVASGGNNSVTATFDQVNLDTSPVLPYETSWLGNSFSSDYDGYVSSTLTSLYVFPDGTCVATSAWDEGSEEGKIFKDGKVVTGFSVNAGPSYENSVTSDGAHLYYYGSVSWDNQGLYETDLRGGGPAAHQLFMKTPYINPKTSVNMLAGLACANDELYLSDALTNQVLVIDPRAKTYSGNFIALPVTAKIDTSGVTNPAPQEVYQTSIQDYRAGVIIPGVKPNATYMVRLHFAETDPTCAAPGKRVMNLQVGDQRVAGYDIFKSAGALNKATTVEFDNVPGRADGLIIGVDKAPTCQAPHVLLCGVEVLNSDGSPFLAVNCGGDKAGAWVSSIHELPQRAFPMPHTGPIVADKAGHLWIMREARDFPVSGHFDYTPGTASIKLYDKFGHYLNKQITDLDNPGAMGYDAFRDRLLVCENGPAQNIRIYDVFTGTDKPPVLESTFGHAGGIFAGSAPGLIHDEKGGGDARFIGPTGVGTDRAGNIYVVCNADNLQDQIMSFKPDGTLNWRLFSLEFCDVGDFDPAHPEDLWTTARHYKMNWKTTVPGAEWTLKSYTTNPASKIPYPGFLGSASTLMRWLHGKPYLFTGSQGFIASINLWRFSGEQALPCGQINSDPADGVHFWIDANGDSVQQPNEVSILPKPGGPHANQQSFSVDKQGNLYIQLAGDPAAITRYPFKGFNAIGAPIYDFAHVTSQLLPPPFNRGLAMGARTRCCYVGGALDTMYMMGEARPFTQDHNNGGTLVCYDHWNTKPVARFITALPDPMTTPIFFVGQPPFTNDGFVYMAFDVANGYAFCSTLTGHIFVVDPKGKIIPPLIYPGPEVSGDGAWEDEAMGLRAHYFPDTGEYVILQENSGWRGRENLYRIRSLGSSSAASH